jgi:peptide/nickel transport system substrate-binding protein
MTDCGKGGSMGDSAYWTAWIDSNRTRRRRLLQSSAALGATAIAAIAGACGVKTRPPSSSSTAGAQGTQQAAKPGGTFNSYIPLNTPLDPQKVSAQPQRSVAGVYSRLFRFKTGLDPAVLSNRDMENELGVSAESPDAVTWTVKMRPDARFTNMPPVNGHAVEAEDIKATYTRILDPATSSPNRAQLGMIDPGQIETPDKTTAVFKLRHAYAPFAKTLTSAAYSLILPREALAGSYDPAKTVIGSGPFTLESAQPDVAYTYKRNADHFEKGRPNVDALKVAVVPDTSQQIAQFGAGNIDELQQVSFDDLQGVKQRNPKATLIRAAYGQPNPIFWQLGDPTSVFQDIRVRRAFSMAIDRDTLSKVIYGGDAIAPVFLPAYMGKWSMLVSDLPADTQQWFKYNPGEAKKLLDAAGASNLEFRFGMVVNGPGALLPTPVAKKHIETVNNMLGAVGIKTNIVQIDYNKEYIDSGKGSSQGYYDKDMIIFGGFSPYTESDEFLFSYFHSKSINSHTNVKDPQLDAMIDRERTLVDDNERLKLVRQIEQYAADKLYQLSTIGQYYYYFVAPRVHDYTYADSLGYMSESYARLWLDQ